MGTPTTSVGAYVAECQRVLASMAGDGIRYELQYVETWPLTTAATARMSKAPSRPCGARYSDATRLCTPWASNDRHGYSIGHTDGQAHRVARLVARPLGE